MKNCKIIFFVLMSCLFLSTSLFAQEKIITGTITDVNGLSTPGVNIAIKGTNKGTQANFYGIYSIKASPGDVLVFSFIGAKTIKQVAGQKNNYDIILEESSSELDEVVVGYGTCLLERMEK
jgi:hypothetical protein